MIEIEVASNGWTVRVDKNMPVVFTEPTAAIAYIAGMMGVDVAITWAERRAS